ncbi:unnamed protein product [Medioppia subpectinata]|uniref:SH2 domain-containing protein n=1 Tax=Medioppia subpectinata TaxID=1979941 RepID=A0A7R9KGS0_9ACAR|nr:unnamed protein product [Medioppia subpectinata]CAG2102043.1 unnamed protein product [Medioppia subpectinata]
MDIRSNAWFHGSIPRSKAEHLLSTSGHFLVRNCSSRHDDYVLSTRSGGHVLHFVISRVVMNANTDYQKIRYSLEDDSFDSITDLITYYVGNKRPLTLASMAVITTPVNRSHPLTSLQNTINYSKTLFSSKVSSLEKRREEYKSETITSYSSEDIRHQTSTPPKPNRFQTGIRLSSTTSLTEQKFSNMSLNCDNLSESSGHSSHKNGSNGSEDSAFFSENISPKQMEENKYETKNMKIINEKSDQTFLPQTFCSQIKAQSFHTYLLPKDNKPLDSSAIIKIQSVLSDTGPRILANHLAKCDLLFIRLKDLNHDFGYGIRSAFETILLPNGRQLRLDLLERHKCLKYFICITILTAINDEKRALILNKWIEIAAEVKTALGDLFGFGAVMEALSMEPILKLNNIWSLVRSNFTPNAINYETKLKPQFKSMIECIEPQAPNTCFPFILTLIQILESHWDLVESQKDSDKRKSSQCLGIWFEQTSEDCGLQQILNHLESGTAFVAQLDIYRRNARIVSDSLKFDELLTDMFKTEFHRQFLFGFRGSDVESDEKFDKFDKIIAALVRKCEANVQF